MSKKIKLICLNCGEEFEVYPSHFERGNVKFCSISCATTYRNKTNNPTKRPEVRAKISANHADVSGDKNPMFGRRGVLAPSFIDGRSKYSGDRYRKILLASGRKPVCAICGAESQLHVHHADGNHENNKLENLIWLCPKCHNTIAHKYERNAKGQFVGSSINERMVLKYA